MADMCACHCGIRVTLREGEVRHVEGNPGHLLDKGVICANGSSGMIYTISLLLECWLFFAQANHPQNLYYQTV